MALEGARVGVDIGGTFTDVAIETGGGRFTKKVLTTHAAPEEGVLTCMRAVLAESGLTPADVAIIIHGTTLATNLLIERKGAPTALLTTDGFRDTIEMRTEGRYEQYDVHIKNPPPLVPRRLRLPVRERTAANGRILLHLHEEDIASHVPVPRAANVRSVAIGFLHSYVNPDHEQRAAALLREHMPDIAISLSCEVSPEMREFERFVTTCVNAYLQPAIEVYLQKLETELKRAGFSCSLFLMHSGGGFTTVQTATRFPVRLVESGPAGGAIFSSSIALQYGLDQVISFDMGGTTAKICLIDGGHPQTTRIFEAAREYRFKKGSGLPLRIPMIEMVEIGTGGGSVAGVDSLGKVKVGPESAGSEPGPACYGRGGERPTVTDADVALGRISPHSFSTSSIQLDANRATQALQAGLGSALGLTSEVAAFAVSEIADEDMANATRVHAIERGKEVGGRTMIAFGGAAPVHAARIAEKLGVSRVIVPVGASVGSAVGFLRAPITYEIVRSYYQRLSTIDCEGVNALLTDMSEEAHRVVSRASGGLPTEERWLAFMRYVGQGYEIGVPIPKRALTTQHSDELFKVFEATYREHYVWAVPGIDVEILSWTVLVTARSNRVATQPDSVCSHIPQPRNTRRVFEAASGTFADFAVYDRKALLGGAEVKGPALIEEEQTTTIVTSSFTASIDAFGAIVLQRRGDLTRGPEA